MGTGRFSSVTIRAGESDLWIGYRSDGPEPDLPLQAEVEAAALIQLSRLRDDVQGYARSRPHFYPALEPLPLDPAAPPVVAALLRAGQAAGVGPMAAVAGAIAEAVGRDLVRRFGLREAVVENGGDLWVSVAEPLALAVYAGLSSLSGGFSVLIDPAQCPCGLACSSGTVGPSLSFGKADAAVVLAADAAAADAWATALGNRVHRAADLEGAVRSVLSAEDAYPAEFRPRGALAVLADRLAAAGSIRLGPAPLNSGPSWGSIDP